jgi:hypothetical protein
MPGTSINRVLIRMQITIRLDIVISHFLKRNTREITVQVPDSTTFKNLLKLLHLPEGMVGLITSDSTIIHSYDKIIKNPVVKLYGIYDGG